MATTLGYKDVLDLPEFRPMSNAPLAGAAGSSFAFDLRHNEDRHPCIFFLGSATQFYKFNIKNDGWVPLASPALTPSFAAGGGSILVPSTGPSGTLTGTWTDTGGALSALAGAATVGVNQLTNRGSGISGYKIRIIGNGSGSSSGLTEERYIIANTSGSTPTVVLDSALSFTPLAGDRYEILSGRVFLFASGAMAAGSLKWYDIATNSYSGNLSIGQLYATGSTDFSAVIMDELYVPNNRAPGEGFFGKLTATVNTNTTNAVLTGTGGAADANLQANEYTNFQIRIVEDATNKTAVGQRRRIASHTAASPTVYTMIGTWAVAPSATAKYVIEYNGDLLVWGAGSTTTFACAVGGFRPDVASGGGNNWATAALAAGAPTTQVGFDRPGQYANRPGAMAVGCSSWLPFASPKDVASNVRQSFIYSIRGGASNAIDRLDIANTSAGTWLGDIVYGNKGLATFTTGTSAAYDPCGTTQPGYSSNGNYTYINQSGTQLMFRFDNQSNTMETWEQIRYTQGTAVVGQRLATYPFIDGATKLGSVVMGRQSSVETFQCFCIR